ncbi:hypothetical protein ACEQ8H_005929 [Pleosporales sp. CAS-2024a]
MASFKKSKFVSACALSIASVAAAVLPARGIDIARPYSTLLHYELHQDYAQATLSVPCTACLGSPHDTDQDDESLIFNFTAHTQDDACGSSNITLNGVHLSHVWNADSAIASGSGSFSAARATHLHQHDIALQRDLDLEWNSACLEGDQETDEAAQVLTLSIKAIDGKPLPTPSGFTLSFKQQTLPPLLLRFASVPDQSATDEHLAPYWRDPPAHLRLVANEEALATEVPTLEQSLEDHLRELRELQANLQTLQKAIADKKGRIISQLRQQVSSLADDINECQGLACIFKAVARKVRGALKVAACCRSSNMGRPSQDAYAPAPLHPVQKSGGSIKVDSVNVPSLTAETNELPLRTTKPSPYLIALELTLGLLCCSCLIAVIRHKCSSLRTRTERAAAREERHTAAAYRHAARKHAWRNWWRGNWRKDRERIDDYEEKRALIQHQESVLEAAMQTEIRQLRAAHDAVNDLVRGAEEGRMIGHRPCNCRHSYSPSLASTNPPASIVSELSSRPLSRTDSLPSYRSNPSSEPPNYDSEVDMSEIVANGFRQYLSSTMSERTSHWTPDSSVIDVSPRPSAETLRYPQSIFTCSEDSDVSEQSDVD